MRNRHRQKGASLLFIVFMIAVIGYTGYMGLKLIPAYLDYNSIRSSIDTIAREMQTTDMSKAQFKASLEKRLDINYIYLSNLKPIDPDCSKRKDDILIYENKKNGMKIGIAYKEVIPMFANLSATMDFSYIKDVNI